MDFMESWVGSLCAVSQKVDLGVSDFFPVVLKLLTDLWGGRTILSTPKFNQA